MQSSAPEAIVFNAIASTDPEGAISSYEWDFGNGQFGMGAVVTHVYAQAGTNQVKLTVRDSAGLSNTITKSVTLTQNLPPTAVISFNQSASDPRQVSLNASGSLDPEGRLTSYRWYLENTEIGQGIAIDLTLPGDGQHVVRLIVSDDKGLTATDAKTITVAPNQPPVAKISLLSAYRGNAPFAVAVSARSSTDPNGDTLSYSWDFGGLGSASNMDASFIFEDPRDYTVVLRVTDSRGAISTAEVLVRVLAAGAVPDPKQNPSNLASTDKSLFADQIRFLYEGFDATQIGVTDGALNTLLIAVLRGRVVDESGNPISGVKVHAPELLSYGYTYTRSDGEFDLVVNGGIQTLLRFEKAGYLFADRPWLPIAQESYTLEEVILLKPDVVVTTLQANSDVAQAAQGSISEDQDGVRKGTLIVPASTSLSIVRPDGSRVAMANLNLRITEYTKGENGPRKMPAPLPPNTGYTYAVDVSADEALALGSKHIEFSKPAAYYVNNFLGFPVGSQTPVGVYDESKGQWVGQPDGRVIKIIDNESGRAVLSLSDDGSPASESLLLQLGIDEQERIRLLESYPVGSELWRVRLSRFSPVDINWVQKLTSSTQAGGGPPSGTPPNRSQDTPSNMACGSIIDLHTLTVRETLPIYGAPFSAHYHSRRTGGFAAKRKIVVPVLGNPPIATALTGVSVEVHVGGQVLKQTTGRNAYASVTFDWDGKDIYGRDLSGGMVRVRRIYHYTTPYALPPAGSLTTFGVVITNSQSSSVNGRTTFDSTTDDYMPLQGALEIPLGAMTLGGWSVDPVHRYDPSSRTLHYGNGDMLTHDMVGLLIDTFAGVFDSAGASADGGFARASNFNRPGRIAKSSDGGIYLADSANHRVRKINLDERVNTVAGNGQNSDAGDGGLAVNASLRSVGRMGVMVDGSLIIPDPLSHRVRRVWPDGSITTIAGNGSAGFSGDGGRPELAQLRSPSAVVVLPDQTIAIADAGNYRVRIIGADGLMRTIAGTGVAATSAQKQIVVALEENLGLISDLATDASGRILVLEKNFGQLRAVEMAQLRTLNNPGPQLPLKGTANDISSLGLNGYEFIDINSRGEMVIAGGGNIVHVDSSGRARNVAGLASGAVNPDRFLTDNQNAELAWIKEVTGVAILDDGTILVSDAGTQRVRRISSGLPSLNLNGYNIASQDGTEIFQFDLRGRHLRTLMSRTGATKWAMVYNDDGYLMSLTDSFGSTTKFERDSTGNPIRIIAPYGQTTEITTDNRRYLASVTDPIGRKHSMYYSGKQLLSVFIKPDGKGNNYSYNSLGEVTSDNAIGGGFSQSFTRLLTSTEDVKTRTTSTGKVDTFTTSASVASTTRIERDLFNGDTIVQSTSSTSDNYSSDAYRLDQTFVRDSRLGSIARSLSRRYESYATGNSTETFTQSVPRRGATSYFDFTEVTTRNLVRGPSDSPLSWTNTYDSRTRIDQLRTPMSRTFETTSDAYERPIRIASPQSEALLLEYDGKGRLSNLLQGGRGTQFAYGDDGLLQSVTDSLNRVTRIQRDDVGQIVRVVNPNAEETRFGYDIRGRMTSLVTPTQMFHEFLFDLGGYLESYRPADYQTLGGQIKPGYSIDGDLSIFTRADGRIINFWRDANFRVNRINTSQGIIPITYSTTSNDDRTYGHWNGRVITRHSETAGRIRNSQINVTSLDGISSDTFASQALKNYSYGAWLTREQYTIGGRGSFDIGISIDHTYDDDGLVTKIGDLNIERDSASGRISGTSLGSISTQTLYNSFGEIREVTSSFSGATIYREVYERDNGGRIISRNVSSSSGNRNLSYSYDALGRLSQVFENGSLVSQYTYSPNGHRSGGVVRGRSISSVFDAQDRLTNYSGNVYTFSLDGETLTRTEASGSGRSYTWNEFSQITNANVAAGNIRYV